MVFKEQTGRGISSRSRTAVDVSKDTGKNPAADR